MEESIEVVIQEFYQSTDEEGWYRCEECGTKVYCGESAQSDLALHEVRYHPER